MKETLVFCKGGGFFGGCEIRMSGVGEAAAATFWQDLFEYHHYNNIPYFAKNNILFCNFTDLLLPVTAYSYQARCCLSSNGNTWICVNVSLLSAEVRYTILCTMVGK